METTGTEGGKFEIPVRDGGLYYLIVVKRSKFWISSNPGGTKQLGRDSAE